MCIRCQGKRRHAILSYVTLDCDNEEEEYLPNTPFKFDVYSMNHPLDYVKGAVLESVLHSEKLRNTFRRVWNNSESNLKVYKAPSKNVRMQFMGLSRMPHYYSLDKDDVPAERSLILVWLFLWPCHSALLMSWTTRPRQRQVTARGLHPPTNTNEATNA